MLHYIDIGPSDVLLDVGGNTGKITELYAIDCKEIVILEPKHALVEYGRTHRPHIKFASMTILMRNTKYRIITNLNFSNHVY